MRKQEYIGISGVTSPEQYFRLNTDFEELGLIWWRNLQLGIKATHKTQFDDIENKYGREWYPVGDEIFRSTHARFDECTTQVAQICFDADRVHDRSYRQHFLDKLSDRSQDWLTGLQYDMLPWHTDPNLIRELREDGSVGTDLIIQCHGEIMRTHSPEEVVRKLAQAAEYFDYVLFDASHGTGRRLDAEALLPYLDKAFAAPDLEHVGIGIAGGLNATVVHEDLPAIVAEFPDLSWDAEGQLHPVTAEGKRPLDLDLCRAYLEASAEVVRL